MEQPTGSCLGPRETTGHCGMRVQCLVCPSDTHGQRELATPWKSAKDKLRLDRKTRQCSSLALCVGITHCLREVWKRESRHGTHLAPQGTPGSRSLMCRHGLHHPQRSVQTSPGSLAEGRAMPVPSKPHFDSGVHSPVLL